MINKQLWTKDYMLLLATTFFAAITHSIFTTVFPVHVIATGGNAGLVGAMITGLTIATIITRLCTGFLSDHFGIRKMLIIGSSLFVLNTAAYLVVNNMTGLFALRIFNGVSQGVYFGAAAISVAHLVNKEDLVEGISYFGIAGSLAAAIAPMIGLRVYAQFGIQILYIAVTFTAIIGLLCTLLISKSTRTMAQTVATSEKQKITIHTLFDFSIIIPAGMILLIMFGNSAIANFLPTFGVERNIANIGSFFMFYNIAIICMRLFNGKLLQKINFNTLLLAGGGMLVIAFIFIAFAHSFTPIFIASILSGLGMGIVHPLTNSTIFMISPPERKGVVSATFALMFDIGNGFGAFAWGALAVVSGYTLVYILAGLLTLVVLVIHQFILKPKLAKNV